MQKAKILRNISSCVSEQLHSRLPFVSQNGMIEDNHPGQTTQGFVELSGALLAVRILEQGTSDIDVIMFTPGKFGMTTVDRNY